MGRNPKSPISPRPGLTPLVLAGAALLATGFARPPTAAELFQLTFEDAALGVQSDGARLRDVLEEIGRQAGFKIHLSAALENEPVSIRMRPLPLRRAVARLLTGYDYVLAYQEPGAGSNGAADREANGLWVLTRTTVPSTLAERTASPASPGRDPAPQPPAVAGLPPVDLEALMEVAATAEDPAQRLEALNGLWQFGGEDPRVPVFALNALSDDNEVIRSSGLSAVLTLGSQVFDQAVDKIVDIALNDRVPELRMQALSVVDAKLSAEAAMNVLRRAAEDPDAAVKAYAQGLLGQRGG